MDFGAGTNAKPSHSYVQLYRSGIVESVVVFQGSIPWFYEATIREAVPLYIQTLGPSGIDPPFYVFLSFVNIKGTRLEVPSRTGPTLGTHAAESDTLLLPEAVLDDAKTSDVSPVLRAVFDMVWNAFGYPRSFNFDRNGQWIGGH